MIKNSTFNDNYADEGACVYIDGDNTNITTSTFKDNLAVFGAGVYIVGSNTNISESTFKDNNAVSGAGVYVKGDDTLIYNSTFEHNDADYGAGVYIEGMKTEISESTFKDNIAVEGAAAYIDGDNVLISTNDFNHNNVSNKGGAVYIHGSNSEINSNNFTDNEAYVPPKSAETTGLGGAIYINGDGTNTVSNYFEHNVVRNGSAIYTDGNNFHLLNDVFAENQAWSYLLIITPKPEESYYNTRDVNVTICHVGGDNIINAIHNTADNNEIHFKNVTYIHSKKGKITTDPTKFVEPVASAELSNNGELLYQDSREFLQNITITNITYDEDNTNIFGSYSNQTNITGEISVTLRKPLKAGKYTVNAEHPNDWNYKYIKNSAEFRVIPYVDISVNKTSDRDVYFVGDIAIWTITVHNAGNGTNATDVLLQEWFPFQYFEYLGYYTNNGTYENESEEWHIGFMGNGTDATLYIYGSAKNVGKHITNRVIVVCNETDWNIFNNFAYNYADVLPMPVPEKTVNNPTPYYGDEILYYLKITNLGDSTYDSALIVIDTLPEGLEFIKTVNIDGADVIFNETVEGQNIAWIITNITSDKPAVITVLVKVNDLGNLTNNLTIRTPDGTENIVNCTVDAQPVADLQIVKLVSSNTAHRNDIITWTLVVTNNGPNAAANVTVLDKLPAGLIYVSDDSNGAYDYETGIWNIGDLDNGELAFLNIVTIVSITNCTVVNLADVTSDTYDPNETNNHDHDSIDIPPEADLILIKEVDKEYAKVRDKVSFKIIVVNNGPDTAINTRVKDVLPYGLKLLSFEVSKGEYDPVYGIWYIGDLAPGEEAYLLIVTEALVEGVIINNAVVESDTYDNDTSNNYDSANVTVSAVPPKDAIPENESPKMPATGNPIVMALLAMLAIVGVTLRRKF